MLARLGPLLRWLASLSLLLTSFVSPSAQIPQAATASAAAATATDPSVSPGGIFVTTHDPDARAVSGPAANSARDFIKKAFAFVTRDKPSPRVLLVTDVHDPGAGFQDSRVGLALSGFRASVADDGTCRGVALSGCSGLSDVDIHTVLLSGYDVIVIDSDKGGWLRQNELDVLNARNADLLAYVNAGGGLVVLGESGGLTTRNRYGFLPFLDSSPPYQNEPVGGGLTPFGTSLGLTEADMDDHSSTPAPPHGFRANDDCGLCGFTVVDHDRDGYIQSLAERDEYLDSHGAREDHDHNKPLSRCDVFPLGLSAASLVHITPGTVLHRAWRIRVADLDGCQ